jgi:hypothetical protein
MRRASPVVENWTGHMKAGKEFSSSHGGSRRQLQRAGWTRNFKVSDLFPNWVLRPVHSAKMTRERVVP